MSLTPGQLPVRLTPLVGRESELDDIVQSMHRNRLITLTGPGGTGKTRLALAAARTAETSFPGGACWVALAQIDDPAIGGQAVATQLGVPDTPGQDPIEAIAKHVADHPVLVVLDNCEHLAEAAARLAEYLLAACPALVMLATSREALGVEGELRRAFESALLATGRLQAAAGRHQAAAAAFRKAVAHEPLNESAHRELMNCWARLGETARAVRHYEELAQVLREQVGVAPAAETEALYRRLLAAQ